MILDSQKNFVTISDKEKEFNSNLKTNKDVHLTPFVFLFLSGSFISWLIVKYKYSHCKSQINFKAALFTIKKLIAVKLIKQAYGQVPVVCWDAQPVSGEAEGEMVFVIAVLFKICRTIILQYIIMHT